MFADGTAPEAPAPFARALAGAWWLHMAFPDVAGFAAWNGRGAWQAREASGLVAGPEAGALPVAGRDAGGLARVRDDFLGLAGCGAWHEAQAGVADCMLVGPEGHFLHPRVRGLIRVLAPGARCEPPRPEPALAVVVAGRAEAGGQALGPGGVAFCRAGAPGIAARGAALVWWIEDVPFGAG